MQIRRTSGSSFAQRSLGDLGRPSSAGAARGASAVVVGWVGAGEGAGVGEGDGAGAGVVLGGGVV